MPNGETTIIVIEPNIGFNTDDFAAEWNAAARQENLPPALRRTRPETFNAEILEIVGRAADFLAIAAFIGVPTVYEILRRLHGDSKPSSIPVTVAETIIDLDPHQKVKRITIRKST
jgi:hypothetical protein